MHALHVLRDRDVIDHVRFIERAWQRGQQQDPVDGAIHRESLEVGDELLLGRVARHEAAGGPEATVPRAPFESLHVRVRRGVTAEADDRERRMDVACAERLGAGAGLGLDLLRERPPVEQPGH